MPSLTSFMQRHALAALLVAGLVLAAGDASAQAEVAEAMALMNAGAEAIENGHFEKAAADFSNALDSGGLDAEGRALAHYHRAISFQKTGQQDAAIGDYTRAIAAGTLPTPVQARAHYNRGIALANAGDAARAEADYRATISLAPDYAAVYHNLANLERRRHAYDAAIDNYSTAIRLMLGSERKLPLFGRALAREQVGNLTGAEADLRAALAIDPEFEVAGAKLAELSKDVDSRGRKIAAVDQTAKTREPRVLPAMLTPFQSASSGNEGGQVTRIASSGGWETTAVRFQADGKPRDITAAIPEPVEEIAPADRLTTASLRPTAPMPNDATASTMATQPPALVAQYRLQLGAFRDEQSAVHEWDKISQAAEVLVGRYEHFVQRVDLGERGIFYRLRAGAFDGIVDARAACKALEARKIECIVVDG
ncbi:SPOR domain-containing protein [Parvibaculum sp.]|uniref:SPOR domain-containing protein n=1 Tax=Parvibaculum sp. TaxID=2024848 RepID=UPI0034A0A8CA